MSYSEKDLEDMKKKLEQLKDVLNIQIEMGEDTTVVSNKVREIERILFEHKD